MLQGNHWAGLAHTRLHLHTSSFTSMKPLSLVNPDEPCSPPCQTESGQSMLNPGQYKDTVHHSGLLAGETEWFCIPTVSSDHFT